MASREKPSRFIRYMGYFWWFCGWVYSDLKNSGVCSILSTPSDMRFSMSRMTLRCSLPKRLATSRLDATGSPFWVDKMMSFMVKMYLLIFDVF